MPCAEMRRPWIARLFRDACLTLAVGVFAVPAQAGDLPDWFYAVGIAEGEAAFPKADLVELSRDYRVEVDADGRSREEIRIVYHLRRGSAAEHAYFRFSENSRVHVESMHGWVGHGGTAAGGMTSSGQIAAIKVAREVDTITRTTLLNSALYSDCRDAIVQIPDPSPGDIFGFLVEVETRFPGLRTDIRVGRGDLPVTRWTYRLHLPAGWASQAAWAESAMSDLTDAPATPGVDGWQSWARGPIAAEQDKAAFAPPAAEAAPAFFVRYREPGETPAPALDSWPAVASWYAALDREALADTAGFAALVHELASADVPADERAARLGTWVRSSVGYVQVYLKDGEIRPHPVGETRRARYGDCKDMAHLCVALFRSAGFQAWPVLTSAGGRGFVRREIPSPFFEHCITALARPDGSILYFDPTAKSVPFGRLPTALDGAWALVIGKDAVANLVPLPEDRPAENTVRHRGTLRLDAANARGEVSSFLSGATAWAWREWLNGIEPARRPDRFREKLARSLPGARISDLAISGLEEVADSISWRFRFEAPLPGQRVGNLLLLQPDFLTWESPTCLPDATPRETLLGAPARMETEADVVLPEGWLIDDLPDSVHVENSIGLYDRSCRGKQGSIRLHRLIEHRRARGTSGDFREVSAWGGAACRGDRELATVRLP